MPVRFLHFSPLIGALLIAGCTEVSDSSGNGDTETYGGGDGSTDGSMSTSSTDGTSTDGSTSTFGDDSDGDGDGDEGMDGGCTPDIQIGVLGAEVVRGYPDVGWKWPIVLRAGDFDGDAMGDVVYATSAMPPSLEVVFGASSEALQVQTPGPVFQIEAGDVNDDGTDELLIGTLGTSDIQMLQFTAGHQPVIAAIPWPQPASAAPRIDVFDLDDDGSADVLLALPVSGPPEKLDSTLFTASGDGSSGLTSWTPHGLPQTVIDSLAGSESSISLQPLQATRVPPTSTTPGMVAVLYEWSTGASAGSFAWLVEQDAQGALQTAASTMVDLTAVDLARYPALFPVATGTIGLVLASDAMGGSPAVWVDLLDPTLTEIAVSPNPLAYEGYGPHWESPRVVDIDGDGVAEVIGNDRYPGSVPFQALEGDATGPTSFGPVLERACLDAADYALTNEFDQPVFVRLLNYCEAGCNSG